MYFIYCYISFINILVTETKNQYKRKDALIDTKEKKLHIIYMSEVMIEID